MKITLGDYELVSTQARNSTGSPVGPDKLVLADNPGVVKREYIGKTRIEPEDVRVHSGTCSFTVHREYATVADALAFVAGIVNEPTEGAFKFDSTTVFEKATLSNHTASLVGCSVSISYTIEG